MAKFKEVENGNIKEGVISIDFNVGEIKQDKNKEVGVKTIVMSMDVKWWLEFYKKRLFELAQEGDSEAFEEQLESYRQFALLDTIGLHSYPIKRNENKELIGLKKDFCEI